MERELERAEGRHGEIEAAMATAATDAERLHELSAELAGLTAHREELEARWLELSEQLES